MAGSGTIFSSNGRRLYQITAKINLLSAALHVLAESLFISKSQALDPMLSNYSENLRNLQQEYRMIAFNIRLNEFSVSPRKRVKRPETMPVACFIFFFHLDFTSPNYFGLSFITAQTPEAANLLKSIRRNFNYWFFPLN
ncbi:hypothetical protein, partial [Bdellovibrio bacteriovorus]|uniref:hypothetical protein n=1 Tax=Bdellovibrio bacteriovorus TaxID=959 RepID=UPI000AC11A7F